MPVPMRLQHLLSRSVWDEGGVGQDLRSYVVDHLGDPKAILVVDETGDLKKGTSSVGVQRQYTGTAGRIENAQVAVHLVYAAPTGHTIIDRALYLPKSWTDDADRCARAGIPDDIEFATKPALAIAMITKALDAGVPASWVTGDEVYGADPDLRRHLQDRQIGYVLAIAANRRVTTGDGQRPNRREGVRNHPGPVLAPPVGRRRSTRPTLVLLVPDPNRHRPQRATLAAHPTQRPHRRTGLLPGVLTPSGAPAATGRRGRTTLAGRREFPDQQGTDRSGPTPGPDLDLLAPLDHPGSCSPTPSWSSSPPPNDKGHQHRTGLIPLTINEFRRLFDAILLRPAHTLTHRLKWSQWRRRRQAQACACHYRRRAQRS